ncbi:MAG: FHA domain-containing protein [Planctomyces sp.]|nr:FHA domain-containing protein [Planctomyces sp.]
MPRPSRSSPTVSAASLLVVQGPDQGASFELEGDHVGLGRGSRNAAALSDTEVSREHARLECRDGQWFAIDLGSSNGTFVNGQGIQRRVLHPGDHLQVGRTVLVYRVEEPETTPPLADIDFVGADQMSDSSRILGSLPHEPEAILGRAFGDASVPRRAAANLQVLYRVTEEIVRPSARLELLLQRLLEIALPAIGADRGCMLVADARTDRIEPRVVVRRPGLPDDERFPVSRSIVQYVIQHGTAVRTSDARTDDRFNTGESILSSGIREALCVPMHGRFELLGVIYADTTTSGVDWASRSGATRFDDEHLALLAAIGRQAASAIESARYQQALVQSERLAAIGQTTAVLSHHIKNILQGVRGGSYLIDLGLKNETPEMVQKGWRIVERNQDRIYRLVMDMLSLSKDRRPTLSAARLNDVVGDVCDLMQAQALERGVTLERRLDEDTPTSAFDAEALHQAILNLIVNGIEALDGVADARLCIATRFDRARDRLIVEVSDNGPGLNADELDRLFNFFESTKGARGTGLGLAVSRKILREHGGDLTVDSQPGSGACFTMSWPRLDPPTTAA